MSMITALDSDTYCAARSGWGDGMEDRRIGRYHRRDLMRRLTIDWPRHWVNAYMDAYDYARHA